MKKEWTKENKEKILMQLCAFDFRLFKKFMFDTDDAHLKLLGSGGFGDVYEAHKTKSGKGGYVIKVIGFKSSYNDPKDFLERIEIQKKTAWVSDNIVKVHDAVMLRVFIDEQENVTNAEAIDGRSEEPDQVPRNCLNLSFVVMDRLSPVLIRKKNGKAELFPEKLAQFEEKEIVKLAYDVGRGLLNIHTEGAVHADIKLENIFYSPVSKRYQIGDFGISMNTLDGFITGRLGTPGYMAPEVYFAGEENEHDCTADIYSFGMILYVLLNEGKFPESNGMRYVAKQYMADFEPAEPMTGSEELKNIVLKMIRNDPDERQQSIREVLNDLDGLKYAKSVKYRREHRNASMLLGSSFAVMGFVILRFSYLKEVSVDLDLWTVLFLTGCIIRATLKFYEKETGIISIFTLILGIVAIFTSGFSWVKLGAVIALVLVGPFAGLFGMGVLFIKGIEILEIAAGRNYSSYFNDGWLAVLLLFLAILLFYESFILTIREEFFFVTKVYLKNLHWYIAGLTFLLMIINPMLDEWFSFISGNDTIKIGVGGLCFCLFWLLRLKLLRGFESIREKKMSRDQSVAAIGEEAGF
ncbi:MAG: protein kinase [Lachnospiraceae bacterium]|nr:protein kinase [Lachnospiraceae bacterium]